MNTCVIEVTNRCNLACKGCYREFTDREYENDLSFHDVRKILEGLDPEHTRILPFFDGEPLINKDIGKIIKTISAMGFSYQIATNGTVDNQELFKFMIRDSNCFNICVSVDGLWSTEFIRGVRSEVPIRTFNKLVRIRDEEGSQVLLSPSLLWSVQSLEEVHKFIDWGLCAGADSVIIRRPLDQGEGAFTCEPKCRYIDEGTLTVKASGDVRLCERYQKSPVIGNVFTDEWEEIRGRQEYMECCFTCPQPYNGGNEYGEVNIDLEGYMRRLYFKRDYFNIIYREAPFE